VRIVGCASVLTAVTVSITTLFYLVYFEPGPSSRERKQETATVIKPRSGIPEQYPTANDDALAAGEHKTLMYAVKRIHDPYHNAQ
jgi:hypothetical protein